MKARAQAVKAAPSPRGRKPLFSREEVVQAALAVVERDGHAALTMRAIAARLGTGIATLYNYFESLAEVNDELALALIREFKPIDARDAAGIRRQMKQAAIQYARVVSLHPDFDQMIGPRADQQAVRILDSALQAMLHIGVDIQRAGITWTLLTTLAQSRAAANRQMSAPRLPEARKRFEGLDAVRMLAETAIFDSKVSSEERFELVLDLMLERMVPELGLKKRRR